MLMIGFVFIALLAGAVHPFKMSLKPSQQQQQQQQQQSQITTGEDQRYHSFDQGYYQHQQQPQALLLSAPLASQLFQPSQAYYQQQQQQQQQKIEAVEQQRDEVKGGPVREQVKGGAPLLQRQPIYQAPPMQFLQPQALAYLIVRPIAQQYQYLEPARYYQQPQPIRGGVKGGAIRDFESEQAQEQEQQYTTEQPDQSEQAQAGGMFGKGKFLKLKSSLEQLAQSAKAKLTLGSTYQVVSEETIQPTTQAPTTQQTPIEQVREELQQQQMQQFKEEPLIAQEPLSQTQERQPIVVQQEQTPEVQQKQEQFEQTSFGEARKEAQVKQLTREAGGKQQLEHVAKEQTRLQTGQSSFEPARATAKVAAEPARAPQDHQQQQQQLKGRY